MTEKVIRFRGVTEPGAHVFSGRYDADVDKDGNWSLILVLKPGDNGAVFKARDDAGNITKVRLTVTLSVKRCESTTPIAIPVTATKQSSVIGDLDGNGVDDTVTVYYDTADDTPWVHMALDYGYTTAVLIQDAQWNSPEAISTVRFGTSNALALVKVSAGATTEIFGVFALIDCDAVYTTSDTYSADGPSGFTVGSSTQYASGVTCTQQGVTQTSSEVIGETPETWEVTRDELKYLPGRGHFDLVSSSTTQLTRPDDQQDIEAVYHFDCPGGRLA